MMRRKLELWLALTFLVLQVTSSGWCKWKCCGREKESIVLNHQYINDSIEPPLNNQPSNDLQNVPLKKNRWFSCWLLKSALINQKPIPNHIVKIMFSYLVFSPVNAKYYPHHVDLSKGVISNDGQWFLGIYFGSKNTYLSDLSSGEVIQTFTLPDPNTQPKPTDCAIAENMKHVIAAVMWPKPTIYLWHTDSGELIATLVGTGHETLITSCCFCFNDTRIVSGSYEDTGGGIVRVWEAEQTQWRTKFALCGHTSAIHQCVATTDGDPRIVSHSKDNTLRVWNTSTGECERVLPDVYPDFDSSCIISSDNQFIGSLDYIGETKIWNINTGECLKTIPTISSTTNMMLNICYVSSERIVWCCTSEYEFEVGVWNVRTNEAEYILPVRAKFVTVSDGGKYLIIVEKTGEEPMMRIYSFDTGKLIK